jgi:hypothetical protein
MPSPIVQADEPRPALNRSEALALVRSTFLRLNDANLTGDYRILGATASPEFRSRFSDADLQMLFAGMRAKKIDLTSAIVREPVIEKARFHTRQHLLQLIGYVPTGPIQTRFEFTYMRSESDWMLFGLSLNFGAGQTSRFVLSSSI